MHFEQIQVHQKCSNHYAAIVKEHCSIQILQRQLLNEIISYVGKNVQTY